MRTPRAFWCAAALLLAAYSAATFFGPLPTVVTLCVLVFDLALVMAGCVKVLLQRIEESPSGVVTVEQYLHDVAIAYRLGQAAPDRQAGK